MTKRIIKQYIGVEVKIKSAAKIGHKTCLLELEDQGDKEEILRNKFKLKNVRNERIYINDELTRNEREQQRQMRKIAKQERGKGNTVKIGYRKQTINGEIWRWNRDKEIIEKERAKN
ncbi:hypothetical protein QE152_g22478 [Popillia japonica]|uniref:Uncharacterized protein n=1 Tax=Popillia japonica TaxID=7064 RepID=A0AAW1KL49_POPJA